MTDYELTRAYAEHGDREAIGALIGRYVDVVYGSALRQVRSKQVAEDVTQGVFLLLLQKASGFGVGVRVGSWLLQATYYACLRAARDMRRREYHERKAAGERREEAVSEDGESRAWVDAALRKLRERDREAVVLRFMRGLALAEVGAELGISEEAARKRVDRAVERLRGLAPAPAEVEAMGVGVVISGMGMRAPEGMLAKVMSQVGGSAGAAGGTAATCAGWAGAGFVMAKVKVAAAVLIGVMAAGAGAVVLPQVVGGTAKQAVAATGPAPVKPEATPNDLALACWGAIVSEDVAGAVWRQMGGAGGGFAPRNPVVDRATGAEVGRADMGVASAEVVRGVLRQALEDGEEIAWAIWAPAVNRRAGAGGRFSFTGSTRDGQVRVIVTGPAGGYRQSGDSLIASVQDGWGINANVLGLGENGFAYDGANRLKLGEAAVAMVQVRGARQWLVVVHEPWLAPANSNRQTTAETFPNPAPWVKSGPELAERWYQEAQRATAGVDQQQRRAEETIAQAIDDESEVQVPYVRDMERNPLVCFGAKTGRPVQIMFGRRDGACVPVQRPELEMAVVIVDPRVVFGYQENGTPITLDEQVRFYMMAYVPRSETQFEREFGAGEYERLGRCEAREGESITLDGSSVVRVKTIGGKGDRGSIQQSGLQGTWSVKVEATPPADGEYVVIGFDEQDRPHFPMYATPMRNSPADGMNTRPRVRDGVYAIRGELKAVEVWHRPWKKVTVKGYAREVRVEGK